MNRTQILLHFLDCSTPTYLKKDGFSACGIFLGGLYNFTEAEEKCQNLGAKLPDILSEEENEIISKYRVSEWIY